MHWFLGRLMWMPWTRAKTLQKMIINRIHKTCKTWVRFRRMTAHLEKSQLFRHSGPTITSKCNTTSTISLRDSQINESAKKSVNWAKELCSRMQIMLLPSILLISSAKAVECIALAKDCPGKLRTIKCPKLRRDLAGRTLDSTRPKPPIPIKQFKQLCHKVIWISWIRRRGRGRPCRRWLEKTKSEPQSANSKRKSYGRRLRSRLCMTRRSRN